MVNVMSNSKYLICIEPYSLECGEVGKRLYWLPISNHRTIGGAFRKIASMIGGKLSKTFRSDHSLYGVGYHLYILDTTTKEKLTYNQAKSMIEVNNNEG